MISAEEARKISERGVCDRAKYELGQIEKDICKSAEEGYRKIRYDQQFHYQTIRTLKAQGYEVKEFDSQRDGYSVDISW